MYMQWPSTDRGTEIVDHVPYNLAPRMLAFFAVITGAKVNREAGYGLEVPCVYHLYGPTSILTK